ncbi:NADH dehydrogenase [ubiquinone] 1 beta subcomplex subunit 5, mitochondrial isoform X2 [Cephus cinctus]|nr:NADH dehydrogenase [ubiquinone] 1 beta subcomplex subunit 5, mitochondrial isoform X2 [Cephus cinctus]
MSDHERTLPIIPSRWQWDKTKDLFHFYFLIGAIPLSLLVLYVNIFIGPATLQEIPEGYEPSYYEYERHPISRFIARYIYPNPQKEYEKYMQYVYVQSELAKLRKLYADVKKAINQHADHEGVYYYSYPAKYHRAARHMEDTIDPTRGA